MTSITRWPARWRREIVTRQQSEGWLTLAFCGRIEWGICPVTLKAPQVANSLTSLRNVSGTVRIGQRFVVAIGGSNGPELHEVTEVDSEGRIVATNVIQGSAVFVVQKTHQIRNLIIAPVFV